MRIFAAVPPGFSDRRHSSKIRACNFPQLPDFHTDLGQDVSCDVATRVHPKPSSVRMRRALIESKYICIFTEKSLKAESCARSFTSSSRFTHTHCIFGCNTCLLYPVLTQKSATHMSIISQYTAPLHCRGVCRETSGWCTGHTAYEQCTTETV